MTHETKQKLKKIVKIGAIVVGVGAVAYFGYKMMNKKSSSDKGLSGIGRKRTKRTKRTRRATKAHKALCYV